ncbi:MAG: class I SAM-dependent methyltransferase [bacterium]|nr:class I SAM-dependent methyltransferase [bacterium]
MVAYKKIKKFLFNSLFAVSRKELKKQLRGMDSVLDIGCGPNSPVSEAKKLYGFYSVGTDIYQTAIDQSKQNGVHDDHHCVDVLDLVRTFGEKSFDAVVALEIIEHLEKSKGEQFLILLNKIARKKIILSTPNGFLPCTVFPGENPHQEHLSGWTVDELEREGYRCIGTVGLKPIYGERGDIVFRPQWFWSKIGAFSQLITYHLPRLGFGLFCYKKITH